MSFCPSKDIHSVYLDNELPQAYIKKYEEHVASCKKCSAELEHMRKLRELLRSDVAAVTPDDHYLDESFERLQIRMNYAKNTRNVYRGNFTSSFKYIVPAMAAAAVFAVILPMGLNSNATNAPAAVAQAEPAVSTPAVAALSSQSSMNSNSGNVISGNIPKEVVNTSLAQTVSSNKGKQNMQNMIEDVDVFRPNFDNENNISIKITVPGINAVPVTTEFKFPADITTGNLK